MASVIQKDDKLNPFPGLRPFSPDESKFFFGRENEIEEITSKLLQKRFLAVTGASGSGKSSLVLCGLLPKIKSRSSKEEENWLILTMKPGNDPFGTLADSINDNIFPGDNEKELRNDILKLLKEDSDGIAEIIRQQSSFQGGKVLLFIDQFEELFSYGSYETGMGTGTVTAAFINLLSNAVRHDNPDFYLVIAVRSDLLSECAHHRIFANLINNSNYFVSKMNRENIRLAIEGPIKNAGADIDSDLVELLVNEVGDRADQLPVLQHVLMRTWIRWRELDDPERPLDFSDYFSIGTIRDAISRHADEIYETLDPDSKKICERLFKIISGKGPDNKGISYPVRISILKSAIRCSENDLFKVIDKFRNPSISILSPHHSVTISDDSIIDLSHESLIHLWSRLKQWVEEESMAVQMYLRLSEASALFQQGKTSLLQQPELQIAINWREHNKPSLWWARRYNPAYERAMVYLRTSEKEFLESEERKKRHNNWRLSRSRIISSILGGILIILALLTIGTVISKISSDNRRKMVEKQKEEIEAQKNAADKFAAVALRKVVQSDSATIVARRSEELEKILRINAENQVLSGKREIEESRQQYESAARMSLLASMTADSAVRMKNETQRLRMISIAKGMSLRSLQIPAEDDLKALLALQGYLFNKSSNGNRNDPDIYTGLYSLAKQRGSNHIRTFNDPGNPVRSIAFVPGRNEFFTSDSNGKILKWDAGDNRMNFQIIYSGNDVIDVIAVSPRADWLACGGMNNSIRMIPVDGVDQGYELRGHSGKIKSLIFSFDGKYLYSAALDGKVLKWDLSARTSEGLFPGMMQITSIDLSSNNRYLAGIDNEGKVTVWNQEQDSERFRIESEGKVIKNIRFRPDKDQIAIGYDDGMAELWDINLKKKISGFRAHKGLINDIRFNANLSQFATSGIDGTLKLWDADDLVNPPVTFTDSEGIVIAFEFSPDGEVIISASSGAENKIISRPAFADSFAADGCSYVTRNFTPEEWLAYVGKDIAYEKTCSEADFRIRIREIR